MIAGLTSATAETVERGVDIRFESEIFATRGDTILTHAELDVRLDRIPEEDHIPFLANPQRIERLLRDEMLMRRLAEDGIRAGILEDEHIRALVWQAAVELIAERHVNNVLAEAELDDYSQQAREMWLSGGHRPRTVEKFDFTHLLVSTGSRGDAGALRQALQLHERVMQGASLDQLIEEFSEDPSAQQNQGRFAETTTDELEPEFARALSELREPGQISEPVRTRYGWHIIRLDHLEPSRQLELEEALPQLAEVARRNHRENVRDRYYAGLMSPPLEIREGAVRLLLERYGVDQVLEDAQKIGD